MTKTESKPPRKLLLDWLLTVHYEFYMSRKDFWYKKELQESDKNFCVLASNLRQKEKA